MTDSPQTDGPDRLQTAIRLHRAGQTAEAEPLYRQILADNPNHAQASYYLGVIALQYANPQAAVALISKAIDIQPNLAEAYLDLANAQKALGRADQAIGSLRRLLEIRPDYAEAHANLGVLLKDTGQSDAALESYTTAIRLKPEFLAAHYNLANALKAENRCDEAIESFLSALAIHPAFVDGHLNLGSVYEQTGDLLSARTCYQNALAIAPKAAPALCNLAAVELALGDLDAARTCAQAAIAESPGFADPHRILGMIHRRQGHLTEAAESLRNALSLNSENFLFYNTLGLILHDLEDMDQAIDCFEKALNLQPDFAEAHGNLANLFKKQDRVEDATRHYQRALHLKPDFVDAHNNWGTLQKDQGLLEQALASYQTAVALDPDHVDARNNLGHTQLLTGDFAAGWDNYRWRWKLDDISKYQRLYDVPLWDGDDLNDKTLFVHPEQGLGDFIQFIRYLPLVAERGGQVILECPRALYPMYENRDQAYRIIRIGQSPGVFDFHIPLLDLPRVLGTDLATIPPVACAPRVAPAVADKWKTRLADRPGRRIGLVWAGNPAHKNDARRSMDPSLLIPLTRLPDISLFSLQVGHGDTAARLFGTSVTDLAPDLTSFADTAAAMQQLDLVISVDSSPAHLAGSLGVPVWTLLPFMPDWRWLMGRDDSPWYPSLRLFRQPVPGDWHAVIERLCQALTAQA